MLYCFLGAKAVASCILKPMGNTAHIYQYSVVHRTRCLQHLDNSVRDTEVEFLYTLPYSEIKELVLCVAPVSDSLFMKKALI